MKIAIPLFPEVTALDAVGPYEVLQRLPGVSVVFVGEQVGTVRTDNGFLGLSVDATLAEVAAPEVIVMPGGIGTRRLVYERSPILDWLRRAHSTTRYTTSVCTGSIVLAAAGLLGGLAATTHWSMLDQLEAHGAVPTKERVVEHLDQRIITAAGVSAGIDMALRLSELVVDADAARAMQVLIEYDPQPPFDAGSTDKAGPVVMARVMEYMGLKH